MGVGTFDDGAEEVGALVEFQGFETASEGVDKAETGGFPLLLVSSSSVIWQFDLELGIESDDVMPSNWESHSQRRVNLIVMNIVCNVFQDLIWLWFHILIKDPMDRALS